MACGHPWPCANAKERLATEFRRLPSGLAVYMSAQFADAYDDLTAHNAAAPPDLYDRFISWIRVPHQPGPSGDDAGPEPA